MGGGGPLQGPLTPGRQGPSAVATQAAMEVLQAHPGGRLLSVAEAKSEAVEASLVAGAALLKGKPLAAPALASGASQEEEQAARAVHAARIAAYETLAAAREMQEHGAAMERHAALQVAEQAMVTGSSGPALFSREYAKPLATASGDLPLGDSKVEAWRGRWDSKYVDEKRGAQEAALDAAATAAAATTPSKTVRPVAVRAQSPDARSTPLSSSGPGVDMLARRALDNAIGGLGAVGNLMGESIGKTVGKYFEKQGGYTPQSSKLPPPAINPSVLDGGFINRRGER